MCDCFFWAKMTLTYEALHEKTNNFNKNLPKSVGFDHGIRHFDATKSQNGPLRVYESVCHFKDSKLISLIFTDMQHLSLRSAYPIEVIYLYKNQNTSIYVYNTASTMA